MSDNSRFVFVGERRSARAVAMGVSWEDGRLAAKTLHAALRAAGIDPAAHLYFNLFEEGTRDWQPCPERLRLFRYWTTRARIRPIVVALGRHVQRALTDAGIPHVAMVHPAARGEIRRRERYHAHVAEVLLGGQV